ncbi:hemagglutinin [Bifidobacterium sp. UTCIF-1]|uniref:hemagglutinin n=1 Tax=unclassified Bifidobacterium TaxID=2608897 RepID=UPI001D753AA8|nr:hemagglutinin [Bifidobacterium sp. UTCIF-1]TPF81264.1 hemagglutinin [Bifidobacterium sp. UTCIF-24]TPF82045.1 hemagglutinin [Bifidobacterium sp. UTCIF-3]TPF85107.1 hemagglutinin [Bifidobacterium sp. UTCIF-36]TPF91392.1 hemagglutinin [Bifidobacterium sp. UTBIF-56]
MTQAKQSNSNTRKPSRGGKPSSGKSASAQGKKARSRRPASARSQNRGVRNPLQWWKHAGPWQKVKAVFVTTVVIICAMALALVTVRFAEWRIDVKEAETRQLQLTQEYDFDPGDIISDGQFFNGNAMSESEVQSFLDEQGAACSGAECLKSKTFDTTDEPADEYCDAYKGAKGETAAAIITKSAKACGISQKVLLTVLQKEQHLVTATTITDFQYKAAMGLSCPDDANCDPQYAGFFKQVFGSAKRYQYYTAHEDRYGYHANALNYVQYHPNASCGGTDVYIRNKATALLYIYTPYQPNEAALAAGVGEGDSCSSYGNRNFSIIYESWFGSPRS